MAGRHKIYPCVSGGTSDRDLDPLQNATHEYSPGATPNDYVNLKSPDPAYVNLQVSLIMCTLCTTHNITDIMNYIVHTVRI